MRDSRTAEPYKMLGEKLRALRSSAHESLVETSSAVEIGVAELASFETGKAKPNQEILLLLISHFEPSEILAVQLWQLAGYSSRAIDFDFITEADDPALYTDLVEVNSGNYGLTLEFKQSTVGKPAKSLSKIGMSREHAQRLIQTLALALAKNPNSPSKLLPGSDQASAKN